mmetsp:Transcript_13382/g.31353  ORF Transcript_13382/g.31353 Transcript_13382/m.31353 type:complete len:764 (+) Transcript_13382:94-2385(+)
MEMEMDYNSYAMPKDEPMPPCQQFNGHMSVAPPERGDSLNSLKNCPTTNPLSSGLLLPDAVKRIAQEGIAIRWDPSIGCYEVFDGPLFEQRIEQLRRKREGGRDSGRPFSRMHKYYTLESGIGWAKTAAIFKPKSVNLVRPPGPAPGDSQPAQPVQQRVQQVVPTFSYDPSAPSGVRQGWQAALPMASEMGMSTQAHQNAWTPQSNKRPRVEDALEEQAVPAPTPSVLNAEGVTIKLMTGKARAPYVKESFEVSLQHFLDTINAGEKYQRAVQRANADVSSGASSVSGDSLPPTTPISWDEAPSPIESELGLNLKNSFDNSVPQPEMADQNNGWNLWTATSKGDQAYFFQRKAGQAPFPNGAIVALSCGNLVPADAECEAEMLLVVSDLNAKWKGDPHPTPEQEARGHWCAYLGQVPIRVHGAVKAGQYIGPAGDGSGYGKVCVPGEDPVVGLALADKEAGAEEDVVKCMVSVGLNVLATRPATLSEDREQQLIQRISSSGRRVRALCDDARRAAEHAQRKVAALSSHVHAIQAQLNGLEQASRSRSDNAAAAAAAGPGPALLKRSTWACLFGLCSVTVEEARSSASSAASLSAVIAPRSASAQEFASGVEEAAADSALTMALMLATMASLCSLSLWRSPPDLDATHLLLLLAAAGWLLRPVLMLSAELARQSMCGAHVTGEKGHVRPRPVSEVVLSNRRVLLALLAGYALLAWTLVAGGGFVQTGYVFGVVETLKLVAWRAAYGRGVECQLVVRQEAAVSSV